METEMPDRNAYDEPRYEDSLDVLAPLEDRFVQDVFQLYDMLRQNESYVVRTPEADAERDVIMREIAELESFSIVGA